VAVNLAMLSLELYIHYFNHVRGLVKSEIEVIEVTETKATKRKAIVYIDGFNLYFALKEKNWRSLMWLDLLKLGKCLLRPDQDLVCVKYFTARIKNDPAKQQRQNAFLDALATLNGLEIYEGTYQNHEVMCFDCGRKWHDDKEKQTDVSIATHMLTDSHTPGLVDDLILITADSDQCPAMRAVHALGKNVLIVLPPGRENHLEVQGAADSKFVLTKRKLRESLLPEEVKTKSGFVIKKPDKYK
jgi:uncharacterized LabA/DUF88 family protein